MKRQLIFLLVFLIIGCSPKIFSQNGNFGDDDMITELSLFQFNHLEKFRLLEEVDDAVIVNYLSGFTDDSIDLKDYKFSFRSNSTKWDLKKLLWDEQIMDKVTIVPDFESVPKIPLTTPEKADLYISMSNPVYSKDKEYALININILSNLLWADVEGYILVFKREGTKWKYVTKFTAYLT